MRVRGLGLSVAWLNRQDKAAKVKLERKNEKKQKKRAADQMGGAEDVEEEPKRRKPDSK